MDDRPVNFETIIIGGHKIALSRYRHYKMMPDRKTLKLYLDQPREILKVNGQDNIAHALLEIEAAFSPSERGWKDL